MSDHAEDSMEGEVGDSRRKLPEERWSITHKAEFGGFEMYITAGMFPDGTLGEVFIRGAGKEGSTVQGLLDAWATMFSIGIQYGAEFPMLARKFAHMRFEPMGVTGNPKIPKASSLIDYVVRWLAVHFGDEDLRKDLERIAKEMHG